MTELTHFPWPPAESSFQVVMKILSKNVVPCARSKASINDSMGGTDVDLESSLARAHCTLAGLFDGNLLFIELLLEQYNQSWYIGAMVGVAACHDEDQGSSPHVVKNNIFLFLCYYFCAMKWMTFRSHVAA
jgi:hypothetical protein